MIGAEGAVDGIGCLAAQVAQRATSSWVGRMMLCQNAGLSGEAARLVICELNWLRRRLTICVDRSRADWVSLVA